MEALFREKPAGVEIEMACFEVYNEAVSDRNPNRDMNEGRQVSDVSITPNTIVLDKTVPMTVGSQTPN